MIKIENLYYAYPGAKETTLKGVNFNVEKGEIFGFLGPSGAGKSTTQKIVIGLLNGYQGHVSVMGKEINEWKRDYYEHIGVSYELPNLYLKLTALENLNFIRTLYGVNTREPMELLTLVGLQDDANLKVAKFSKGMKMRLNFIRALINNPELIFLDEPTSGLDPVNAKTIKEIILRKKQEGKTIFLTTHDMTVADDLCDRVAFITEGIINLIDSPKKLKLEWGKREVKVEYGENGHPIYRVFELDGIGHNELFLELLRNQRIRTIHTQEATLEDIFIYNTGRTLS